MKIYNEIVIDMNPESSSYRETLYEDSYDYSGDLMLMQGPDWMPQDQETCTERGGRWWSSSTGSDFCTDMDPEYEVAGYVKLTDEEIEEHYSYQLDEYTNIETQGTIFDSVQDMLGTSGRVHGRKVTVRTAGGDCGLDTCNTVYMMDTTGESPTWREIASDQYYIDELKANRDTEVYWALNASGNKVSEEGIYDYEITDVGAGYPDVGMYSNMIDFGYRDLDFSGYTSTTPLTGTLSERQEARCAEAGGYMFGWGGAPPTCFKDGQALDDDLWKTDPEVFIECDYSNTAKTEEECEKAKAEELCGPGYIVTYFQGLPKCEPDRTGQFQCSNLSWASDESQCPEDECGVQNGDNSTCLDECGIPNGDGSSCTDDCGVVDGDGSSCADCAGNPNGEAVFDECGICGGGGATGECGCEDIPTGACNCDGDVVDQCGECGGDGTSCVDECGKRNPARWNASCEDCMGVANGDAQLDECGVCNGPGKLAGQSCPDEFGNVVYDHVYEPGAFSAMGVNAISMWEELAKGDYGQEEFLTSLAEVMGVTEIHKDLSRTLTDLDEEELDRAEREFMLATGGVLLTSEGDDDAPFQWENLSRYDLNEAQYLLGEAIGAGLSEEELGGKIGGDYRAGLTGAKEGFRSQLQDIREGLMYDERTAGIGLQSGTSGTTLRSGTGIARSREALDEAMEVSGTLAESYEQDVEKTTLGFKSDISNALTTYMRAIEGEKTGWWGNITDDIYRFATNSDAGKAWFAQGEGFGADWSYDEGTFTPAGYGDEDWAGYKELGDNKYCPDGSLVPADQACPELNTPCPVGTLPGIGGGCMDAEEGYEWLYED